MSINELKTTNTREILFYRDGTNEVKIEVLLQKRKSLAYASTNCGTFRSAKSRRIKTSEKYF